MVTEMSQTVPIKKPTGFAVVHFLSQTCSLLPQYMIQDAHGQLPLALIKEFTFLFLLFS